MTANNLIRKLFKLTDLKIITVVFKSRAKKFQLYVKPFKNGCRCPICERRCTIKRFARELRTWRDVCVCGWTVCLLYAPKEIECPTHGRVQEKVPWADKHARITYRLEYSPIFMRNNRP